MNNKKNKKENQKELLDSFSDLVAEKQVKRITKEVQKVIEDSRQIRKEIKKTINELTETQVRTKKLMNQTTKLKPQIDKLENKTKEIEDKLEKTWIEAIKSVGRISIIISLGLTAIVSLIGVVQNRASFEWWQFLVVVFAIFIFMILFFISCTHFIFRMLRKERKK